MEKKKRHLWLSWLVAILLVGATVGTYVYVHHLESIKEVKITKQKKIDEKNEKINKKLIKKQKKNMTKPISWDQPSETLPYPDIKKYKNYKTYNRVWLSVDLKAERLYVHQGPYTIYTMYAYANRDYDEMSDNQRTPTGIFKIHKNRGTDYYDAPKGYFYHAWLSFGKHGNSMIQSVPTTENGGKIKKITDVLGKRYKHKHVVKTNGAIWLSAPDAKWLVENIPAKTIIIIQSQKEKTDPYQTLKKYYEQKKD
ncbi:L,D-transpeptidase [Ligilactobacillus cholophilus]|uniref:L,D-transpeptidase n=1 Tax=Ligilactobacillus cholophilus TaxID=3050131 RepID=UPI0025AF3F38|nr:L,D-transpeptidase [Ligilactobacillus cholophilus]